MLDLAFQTHQHMFDGSQFFCRYVGFPDAFIVAKVSSELSEEFKQQGDKGGHEATKTRFFH